MALIAVRDRSEIYTSTCVISKNETEGFDADDLHEPSLSMEYAMSSFTTCLYLLLYVGNLDRLLTIPTSLPIHARHHHQNRD